MRRFWEHLQIGARAKAVHIWLSRQIHQLVDGVVDPIILLPPEDTIAHQAASYVYLPEELRPEEFDGYRLDTIEEYDEKACAYVHHEKQEVVIAYKGTNFSEQQDVMSDVGIILGVSGVDTRVAESLAYYDAVRLKYPSYKKMICGHSLGGTLCYIVAKHRLPDRCVVFNPGASLNTLFVQMLSDTMLKKPWTKRVFTYRILGDPVSLVSFVGNTKVFRVPSVDPKALHELKNFRQVGVEYVDVESE